MKGIWKYGIIALIAMVIGFFIAKRYFPTKDGSIPIDLTLNTDTVYLERYKAVSVKGKDVKPKTIVKYDLIEVPRYLDKTKVVLRDTFIFLDNPFFGTYRLKHDFLEQYPFNPKLIKGVLTKEGFSLDLLDTSGQVTTQVYKTDYSSKDYFIYGSSVKSYKKNARSIPGISKGNTFIHTSSNAYLTYEIFHKSPTLAVDYSLNIGNLGLYGLGAVNYNNITQNAEARLSIGLKLKLR